MKKKSQMEIMGLLIIVILFSLGLLFTIRFMATRERSTVLETFTTTELAANMLNAMLKTTVQGCKEADMTDLFRDCAAFPTIDCDSDGSIYSYDPELPDSCAKLRESINFIFSRTLDIEKKRYLFNAYIIESQPLPWAPIAKGGCTATDVGELKEFIIPTDLGDLTVSLKICT